MKSVRHLLSQKPSVLFSVERKTSVFEVLHLMMKENISAVLVIENEKLIGIFTERDYARKIVLQGKSSKDTDIGEVMSSNILTINPKDSVEHCMKIMTDRHFRHLPVVENDKVTGIISIGDIVRFVIEDQKKTIEQLENYISS